MPLGILAWVLFVLWIVLGGVAGWRTKDYWWSGASLLLALLLALIMWKVFGPIVQGG